MPLRLAAFALLSLVWGLTWWPTKVAAEHVPPILLAAARFVAAGLCFGLLAAAARLPLAVPHPARVAGTALLITTGCYAPLFWGVARAPTGLAALTNLASMPILLMLFGALAGSERITGRRLLAVAVGAGGLALLFSARIGPGREGATAALGLAAVLAGTASYAAGAVLSRPLTAAAAPVSLAFWQTLVGGLALVPVSMALEGPDLRAGLAGFAEPRALVSLAALVGGGSLLGFSIYLWLVREWGAFRAGLYAFVSPAVAVGVGVGVLGEAFGWPEALGMAAALGATALVLLEPRREDVSAS